MDICHLFEQLKVDNLLIQMMTLDKNLSVFVKAMKTGQTGCYQLIMLHVATTFEEYTAYHPCEDLQGSVECHQMRASREYLKDKIIYNCMVHKSLYWLSLEWLPVVVEIYLSWMNGRHFFSSPDIVNIDDLQIKFARF